MAELFLSLLSFSFLSLFLFLFQKVLFVIGGIAKEEEKVNDRREKNQIT